MEEVIVVTINYRLQALGFLCLPSMNISGNAALKDQQMALQWVYENISNFGGDPEKICLFGESAGAASVHLQLLNPKSRKLINSAIMQSNCVLADWLFQKNGEEKTRRLAKLLGSRGSSDEELFKTLMVATPQQIYENSSKVFDPDENRRCLPFVFKPVIEKESKDAFITKTPLEMLKTEQIEVPIMMGLLDGDGMTMGSFYRKKLNTFDNDYVRLVPISLSIDPNSSEARELGRKIKTFYFGNRRIDEHTISEFVDFMTDFHFTIPQTMCNELHARFQHKSRQYVYEFKYDGELNIFKQLLKMSDVPKSAAHFDELFYLFDAKIIGKEVSEGSSAWKMRQRMCKMWANFARLGDPTPVNSSSFVWKPVQSVATNAEKVDIDYLVIDENFEMKKNMYKERVDFWREIYTNHNSSFLNPKF